MSGFDVRFSVEGVLHVQADSAEAAESAVVDILEDFDCRDADETTVEACTVRAVGMVNGDESSDDDTVRSLDRRPRCVGFAS